MSFDFCIAIPTFNGGHRLGRLLENLLNQEGIIKLKWEILIVDNNSTDGSRETIAQLVEQHKDSAPRLRSVCETRQGAAFARIRAMQECSTEFVAFLDDDIYPSANWIRDGLASIRNDPKIGVVAGKTLLSKSLIPFEDFDQVARFFAIDDLGDTPFLYRPSDMHMPPSAAVWVRREAWQQCVVDPPMLSGPSKDFPFGGEDYEVFTRIALGGWDLQYEPKIACDHELDASRFEKPRLKRLAQIIGNATYPTRLLEPQSKLRAFSIALRMIARGTLVYINHNRSFGWGNPAPAAYMLRKHSIGFALSPIVYAIYRLRGKIHSTTIRTP